MREFLVYTCLRLALLVACLAVVLGVWGFVPGLPEPNLLLAVLLGLVLSGVASYFLLDRQREELARLLERRAERASARFEQMRAKEDRD